MYNVLFGIIIENNFLVSVNKICFLDPAILLNTGNWVNEVFLNLVIGRW